MNAPLAALLVAALAAPSFAQSQSLQDAAKKIAGQKFDPARAAAKTPPPVAAKLVRPILENAVVKQLLAGDYERNERAERGLSPDVLGTFVVLSHKKDVLSEYKERHMVSVPSGKLVWLPRPELQDSVLKETQRIPDEVRSIGSHHLGVTHPDESVAYYDLADADETRPSVYQPKGKVTTWVKKQDGSWTKQETPTISDLSDTALLPDAMKAAGFSDLDIQAARSSLVTARAARKNPEKFVIFGKKSTQLVILSGDHPDEFWPKVVIHGQ